MPWFRCLIEGESFPIRIESAQGPVGFFTTRWVQANTPEAAEQTCIEQLRSEPSLAHAQVEGVTPKVFVREVEKVADGQAIGPNAGFTFFPMES